MFGRPVVGRDHQTRFEIDSGPAGDVDAGSCHRLRPMGGVAAAQIGGERVARPVRIHLQIRRDLNPPARCRPLPAARVREAR
jgi:hypothetical protein